MSIEDLAARLAAAREKAGLTQAALAAKAGMAANTVARYERGEVEPSATALAALCRALGASADRLLGLRPPR